MSQRDRKPTCTVPTLVKFTPEYFFRDSAGMGLEQERLEECYSLSLIIYVNPTSEDMKPHREEEEWKPSHVVHYLNSHLNIFCPRRIFLWWP